MNKAFVREPDHDNDLCPRCQSRGLVVRRETFSSHSTGEVADRLTDPAFFCSNPTCEVAYFDIFERVISTTDLQRPLYPKDPSAPICPCFNLTCDDIDADIREHSVTRVKSHLQRTHSESTRCLTSSATGQSCSADVQRYYFKNCHQ